MILLCYDGSADAQAAIDHAARLMPGAEVTVLTVWEPFLETMTHGGSVVMGWAGTYADRQTVDAASEQSAVACAAEGVNRARAAGLVAQPQIAGRDSGGVASAVLDVAADVDADAVVLGTRGRGGVKSFLLGSVSHDVSQHADRAVLIVPSPALVEQRRRWAHHADDTVGAT